MNKLLEEKDEHISHLQEQVSTLEKRLNDVGLSEDDRVKALETEVLIFNKQQFRNEIFSVLSQTSAHCIAFAVSTSGATYLVTMACVCPVVWLFVSHRPPPPPRKSSDLKNSKTKICFSSIWATFPGGPPPPPLKGKIFDTRFGLIHVQTGKKNVSKKFL